MADTKVSALTSATPIVTDELYLIDDPSGTPLSKRATVDSLLDLRLYRDAANELAQRNGVNDQAYNLYNTYTDASNYERLTIGFDGSDNGEISLNVLGTGSALNNLSIFAGVNVAQAGIKLIGNGTVSSVEYYTRTTHTFFEDSDEQIRIAKGYMAPGTGQNVSLGLSSAGRAFYDLYMDGRLMTKDGGELTIATGALTITGSFHTIDTESDGASDDLDTISGGLDGARLVIMAENTARTVVVKDGTGNLKLAGDFTMDNTEDTIELIYSGAISAWCELSRSANTA